MSRVGSALIKGGVFRLVALAISLLLQLAMLPFILQALGSHQYGLWAVVGAASGYYGFLDLGVSSAITRFVSRELGRGDAAKAAEYVAASRRVFLQAAVGVASLSAVIAWFGGSFIDTDGDRLLFMQTVVITGLGIACTFPSKVHVGILTAELRHDVIASLGLASHLVRAGCTYLVLAQGGGLLGLAATNAAVSMLHAGATVLAARRCCGHLPYVAGPSPMIRKELFGYAGYSLLSRLADFFRFKAHPLTISAFLRFSDVTPYAIHDRLQSVVVSACDAVLSNLTAVFSRQEGKEDQRAMRRLFFFAYKISCYLGGFSLGLLVIMAPAFVERWLGPGYGLVVTLLYIRAVGSLAGIIQMPVVNLLFGSAQNRTYAYTNCVHAALTLGSTVLLAQSWGLVGVVAGVSATTAIMKTGVQAQAACRMVGLSLMTFHRTRTLPHLALVTLFLLPIAGWGYLWLTPTWPRLIIFGAVSAALFGPYVFRFGFSADERSLLLRSSGFDRWLGRKAS